MRVNLEMVKSITIIYLLIFNCTALATEYYPRLKINDIVDKIENSKNAMYFNVNKLDEKNLFKQIYYKEIINDSGLSFQKGLIEYSFLKSDGIDSYGYSEHFYDCLNNNKIIYRQNYNNEGIFFTSDVFLVNLNKYSKEYDKSICKELIVNKE